MVLQVPDPKINDIPNESKPNPDGCDGDDCMQLEPYTGSGRDHLESARDEQSNPNDSGASPIESSLDGDFDKRLAILEPELDCAEAEPDQPRDQNTEPLQMGSTSELPNHVSGTPGEECPSNSHPDEMQTEPDSGGLTIRSHSTEPDLDDPELRMIQDPVTEFCDRLQSAVQSLRNEAMPSVTEKVLQTLIKIVRYA